MSRWLFSLLILLSLSALPADADVDIPFSAGCQQLMTNSVTNRLYTKCGANLVEMDGATHAQRSMAITGNLVGVDPIRNRVIAQSNTQLTVVDVASWTNTSHAIAGGGIVLDPGTDSAWITQASAGQVTRVDLSTGGTTIVNLGATSSGASVTVDPVNDFVYVALSPLLRIVEVDTTSLTTRFVQLAAPITALGSLAIDPLRHLLFVGGRGADPGGIYQAYFSLDTISLSPPAAVTLSNSENGLLLAVEPGSDRLWIGQGSFFGCGGVTALRGSTLAMLGGVSGCNADPGSWAISPGAGRAYQPFGQPTNPGTTGAGIAVWDTSLPPSSASEVPFPNSLTTNAAVMLSTNRVYVGHFSAFTPSPPFLRELDEPASMPIPLPVAIAADAVQSNGNVLVHFDATSGFATPLPIQQIYYQLDSMDGAWTPASPAGPSASATIPLTPGAHTIHAFAVDGQEATIGFIQSRNPVTGPVASLDVVAPALPACANGVDDDGDALADYPADPGCLSALGSLENPQCENGLDDDGDLAIDHPADAKCRGPWDNDEATDPSACGLGAEIAMLLLAISLSRRERGRSSPRNG